MGNRIDSLPPTTSQPGTASPLEPCEGGLKRASLIAAAVQEGRGSTGWPTSHGSLGKKKEAEPEAQKIRTVCYARVSSQKQAADLARQIEALQVAYPDAEVLSDIGSGLNWKRPHFVSLLERAHRGEFSKVVVAHKDRLCRFAFELVEWIFAKAGVEVVVHGDHEPDRNELADDLLSVVNVFVARHNGLRGAASRKRRRERAQQEKKGEQGNKKGGEEEEEEGTTTQKKDKNQHDGKRRKRRHTASSEGGDGEDEEEEEREYSDESEEGGDLP